MISKQRILAVIPARGGSKGVPRKNVREVAGKPLIAWTIEEAKKSKYIDRLILSSDNDEIIAVAKSWGCEVPFKRPTELATDDTPGIEPVLHALGELPDFDYVILLQPTSPLRAVTDIDACLEYCMVGPAAACVSISEARESPYWMYTVDPAGHLSPLIHDGGVFNRRQDLPKVYLLNGAIYVAKCTWLQQTRTFVTAESLAFIMPPERSLDIDRESDLQLLELTSKAKHGKA